MLALVARMTATSPLILGVDLGGTKILTAVTTPEGKMLSRDHSVTPASGGPEAVILAIVESSQRCLKQAGMTVKDVDAVGMGSPGLANSETGVVYISPNLPGWSNVPLRDILQARLERPVFLINDAKAAALGECRFGSGRGAVNFVYVTLSTGIGGGIIIGGRVYVGAGGLAGEIGHMTIDQDGPSCQCGSTGCWEVLGSGTALAREAKAVVRRTGNQAMLDIAGGDIEKITAQTVQAAAVKGDDDARGLISQTAHYTGVGLANLINIFNPERIVIGGGLSNMGDMLLKPAFHTAGERAFKQAFDAVSFALAGLGRNSGVLGAAEYARQRLGQRGRPAGAEWAA